MELLSNLAIGFLEIMTVTRLMYLMFGVVIGNIAGALPGLGATSGCSILLPLTFGMDPISSLVMLAGIYYGTMFGGSITAILLNVPGTTAAAITAVDGHQLAKQGRAAFALGVSMFSSFIGGMFSVLALAFSGAALAKFALAFGAAEYFALTMMGLSLVTGIAGEYPTKGYIMLMSGLLLGSIGIDTISGVARMTFGEPYLMDGLNVVPVIVGLFGFSELFFNLERYQNIKYEMEEGKIKIRDMFPSIEEIKRLIGPITRGSLIGFIVGVLPGAGATIATVLAYGSEKKISKNSSQFGKGAIEGVAVAESSNNASTGGAMVSMLALGIPGSVATAILLTAMVMFGIKPGPNLYNTSGPIVWALISSMIIGNIVLLVVNIFALPIFATIVKKSGKVLVPIVTVLCFIGAYSINGSMFEVSVMLFFGVVGYLLRKMDYFMLPLILGLILGSDAERTLRQALMISGGDWSVFIQKPLALGMLLVTAIMIVFPLIKKGVLKKNP